MKVIRDIDARDVQWEVDRPLYRTVLWTQAAVGSASDSDATGWRAEWSEVEDASVAEVLRWVQGQARGVPGSLYEVYVCVNRDGELGAVRLAGSGNPTRQARTSE